MGLSAGFISLPGGPEWIVIFLVILIIFGPKSLPKIGSAIGRGIREFKDASDGITRAIEEEANRPDDEGEKEAGRRSLANDRKGDPTAKANESGEPSQHSD